MSQVFNKLVRDKIPEKIRSNGENPVIEIVEGEERLQRLCTKLEEEVQEFLEDHSVEEMVDVLEVLHGLAHAKGVTWKDIELARIQKRHKRGGFDEGIVLVEVH